MSLMHQVIEVTRFGGPEVLTATTAPDPEAGPGEVVIDVAAADVIFLDAMIRSGRAAGFFPARPPYVPGGGVAGVVAAAGDGVDRAWLGRRVIARTGGPGGAGGYAARAAAAIDRVVAVPDGVGLRDAAALLHDGVTAERLAERTGIGRGEQVLILGAAGGLGILLAQLARAAGARVIGAARGAEKLGAVAALGAEATVDYSEPDWTQQVLAATGGAGPQVVFDGVGGDLGRAAFGITAAGGRFSAHGTPSGTFAPIDPQDAERRRISVRGIEQAQPTDGEHARGAERVLAAVAAGRISPHIGQLYPLADAAAAHAAIEARTAIGKTLLTVA
ncbi:MAG TPA: zinc-binding dehydrogenase [Streptosporangiaceae bacterium]